MTVYPDDSLTWGPDVSMYQDRSDTPNGIDFNRMKEEGASFVFIRAGQYTWEDPDFRVNWLAAREAGLPRGAYWFLDARGSGSDQGRKFRSLLSEDWGELPPVIDYEHKVLVPVARKRGRTASEWHYNTPQQLDDFIAALKCPRVPMIYTGRYYWTDHGSRDLKYARYPLWIAAYGSVPPRAPLPWDEWTFWQFTDRGPGRILGAESDRIDLNYYAGSDIQDLVMNLSEEERVEEDLADALDRAPRMGAERDEPEGSRYIQLSDTLARKIAAQLREEP